MKRFATLTLLTALSFGLAISAHADHHEKNGKGEMFEKYDTNNDGVISKAEFVASQEERFNKIDLDGNEELTHEELQEAGEKWREKIKDRIMERRERRQNSMSGDSETE